MFYTRQMSITEDLDRFLDFHNASEFPLRGTLHNLWINVDRLQERTFGNWDFTATHEASLGGEPSENCSLTAAGNVQPSRGKDLVDDDRQSYRSQEFIFEVRGARLKGNLGTAQAMENADEPGDQGRGWVKIFTTAELMDDIWADVIHDDPGPGNKLGDNATDAGEAKVVPPGNSAGTKEVSYEEIPSSTIIDTGYTIEEVKVDVARPDAVHLALDQQHSALSSSFGHVDDLEDQPADDDVLVTVGVEFEFLVPFEDVKLKDRPDRYFISLQEQASYLTQAMEWPAQLSLQETLNEAGITTIALGHGAGADAQRSDLYGAWVVRQEHSVEPDASSEGWSSSSDASGPRGQRPLVDLFGLCGVEVNSRKLHADADGFREIETALRVLRENVLMHINENCGLHVHVGATSLSLEEKKHFVCLYLMAEQNLFSFCAPHRRGNIACSPVAHDSRSAIAAREDCIKSEQPFFGGLSLELHRLIQRSSSSAALRDCLLQPGHRAWSRCALAMKHVGQESDDDEWTFEFRHFQGTLDPLLVGQWTRICVALVLQAKGIGEYSGVVANGVYSTICNAAEQSGGSWLSLLRVLGLSDENTVVYWQRKLWAYQTPGGWLQDELGDDGFIQVLT